MRYTASSREKRKEAEKEREGGGRRARRRARPEVRREEGTSVEHMPKKRLDAETPTCTTDHWHQLSSTGLGSEAQTVPVTQMKCAELGIVSRGFSKLEHILSILELSTVVYQSILLAV